MLTLFTVPKPFQGHIGGIQRNAIESWRALAPEIQIVLVGDEDGVEDAAREAGVEHVGGLRTNERGTPRLDSAFELVGTVARFPHWCLVNADILLLDDFVPAIDRVTGAFSRFLMVGESRDLAVSAEMGLGNRDVRARLRERALAEGRLRGYAALDYFVFPRGEFGRLPPFLVGRACFDNWLVWRAREAGDPVVDLTRTVVAVHQAHDYSHVAGGLDEAYYGEEARENELLAGGRSHIYTLHDATHRLHRRGAPLPYWGSVLRARERLRSARAHAFYRLEARRQRRAEQRRTRKLPPVVPARPPRVLHVLAVAPDPGSHWTPVLDALAQVDDLELTALYGAPSANGASPREPPSHVHWFPRRVALPGARRLLGREYPVNWAIWNSYRGLRPDCMVVSGWGTFAAHSAVGWCLIRRLPYLLVLDESVPSATQGGAGMSVVVPRAVARRASAVLVAGSSEREAMLEAGVKLERIRLLPRAADSAAGELSRLVRLAAG